MAFNFGSKNSSNTSPPSFVSSNNGTTRVGFNLGSHTDTNTTSSQPTLQFNFGSSSSLNVGTTGPNTGLFGTFSTIASTPTTATSSGFNFGTTETVNSANGTAGTGFKFGGAGSTISSPLNEFKMDGSTIGNSGSIDPGLSIGLDIVLPCGFSAKFKNISCKGDKFLCPVCKSHDITSQECLNMSKNKILISEFNLDLKKKSFTRYLKNFEICKNDPKSFVDENYENLRNQLDIRREEIKLIVDKKIDDYYENLLQTIEEEKEKKLKKFEQNIQKIASLEQELIDLEIEQSLDITKKLDLIDSYCVKIDDGIKFLNATQNGLANNCFFNQGNDRLDIKNFFGKLDWKKNTKNVKKCNHVNKMDDLSILLPCGFSAKYKDICYNCDEFRCPVCNTHNLTSQECLTITKNRLLLIEKSFELKKNQYEELLKEFENFKNEPKICLDESYDSFKRQVDHRREEIKVMLNEKIDDYHDGLLAKIETKKYAKLKELEQKIKQIEAMDLVKLSPGKNLDINSKLDFYKKYKKSIDNGITLVTEIIDDLIKPKLKLANTSHNISKLFGQLNLKEDEIDDDSRAEETIELVLNDFSVLKDNDNFDLNSKKYIVRNFEWSINVRKLRNKSEMNGETDIGFYLYCNPLGDTKEFSVKVNAIFFLLNKSNSIKDLTRTLTHVYNNKKGYGFHKFTTMNEIMNPKNAFYDANDDSITLKALIEVELP